MPTTEENQHMLMLDVALGKMERPEFCVEGYRRIGAGLREFVFYIADRDEFRFGAMHFLDAVLIQFMTGPHPYDGVAATGRDT